ncbi:unnamed protein product [Amoebophrya sp. A120]|nr:unnamed protein product [Amoebophrya sp. A120]|eukprot:GSA120T00014871001.1
MTSPTTSTAVESSSTATAKERQGVVFDRWPFRLDIAYEYQCWILVAMSVFCATICLLPCLCGVFRSKISKRFTVWVYSRLHTFFCVAFYFNVTVLFFTVGLLPDWTINEYVAICFDFLDWMLIHTVKFLVSALILLGLFILVRFKERIAAAAGVEHMTFFRLGKLNLFHTAQLRGIEVIIWKVEELPSGTGLKPNDVYLECHAGQNEPTRTRVHNNAGAAAVIKETFQVNIDENDVEERFTLLVKDQELLVSSVLCKLQLKTKDVLAIEAQTGKVSEDFVYDANAFSQLQLQPRGKIWLRVNPLEDGEQQPLTSGLC